MADPDELEPASALDVLPEDADISVGYVWWKASLFLRTSSLGLGFGGLYLARLLLAVGQPDTEISQGYPWFAALGGVVLLLSLPLMAYGAFGNRLRRSSAGKS